MSGIRKNALDQALDVAGSLLLEDALDRTLEGTVGRILDSGTDGQITAATKKFTAASAAFTAASVGTFIRITGATNPGNDGEWLITAYIDGTNVTIGQATGLTDESGMTWAQARAYSLEDDLNYQRTDRKAIKGTGTYKDAVPTYERPSAIGTSVPANLTNIAGKTTDAKPMVENRTFYSAAVVATDTFITLSSAGNLKHADSVNRTGVPVFDGYDNGNHDGTYVEIIDPATEGALEVLGGPNVGKRIYGRTRAGSSTSPNSVEVEFRCVAKGAQLSTSVAYTWESGQPTTINCVYGFRRLLSDLTENALRNVLALGIVSDADLVQDIVDIRSAIGIADGETDLDGHLTNTGDYFVWSDLGADPTVVDALNELNEQIGNRDYTGSVLSDGETITASLQALADAIAGASVTRYIERVAADINAGTTHDIPAAYTVDGTGNGRNLWVFWRGILRDPGLLANNDDYEETSGSGGSGGVGQITPYSKIKAGDHVNYFIVQ